MLRERKVRCVWWSILRNPKRRRFHVSRCRRRCPKSVFPGHDPLVQLEPVTARRIFIHDNERFKKGSKEGVKRTKSCFVTLIYDVVHHSFWAKLRSSSVNFMKNKRRSFWKLHSWLRILNYALRTDNMFAQVYIPRIVILLYIRLPW